MGQEYAESFSPDLNKHFFFATGSNSQNPACAARGLIAVLVISYQCLQNAHLRMLGFFSFTTCQIAMSNLPFAKSSPHKEKLFLKLNDVGRNKPVFAKRAFIMLTFFTLLVCHRNSSERLLPI